MVVPNRESIRQGVFRMLDVNLAIRDGEKVLVMTDPPSLSQWGQAGLVPLAASLERSLLARIVAELASEHRPRSQVTFLPYPAVGHHGAELDGATAEAMQSASVIVAINTYSLTHTMARKQACEAGARIASMPEFDAQLFEGPMLADYDQVAKDSLRIAELLTIAKSARLTAANGTDLEMFLEGRAGVAETGLLQSGGTLTNLPAGEAFIAPLEGTAKGRVVVCPDGIPGLQEQMALVFQEGKVVTIEGGGEVGERFRALLELPKPGCQIARRNLAELGIGTNPLARSVRSSLEAEKIKGTVHIAIGANTTIGGNTSADLHQDFVLWEPNLFLDGQEVIRGGIWRF